MKLNPFLSSALFATGIFAAPRSEYRTEKLVHRGGSRSQNIKNATFGQETVVNTDNWAGAVVYPSTGAFNGVLGTFTVPAAGEPGTAVVIELDISGALGQGPVAVQGGIYIFVSNDGTAIYQAFTVWDPDLPQYYSQGSFSFAAGDELIVQLSISSGTQAFLSIQDNNNGNSFEQEFYPSDPSNAVIGNSAGWTVELAEGTTLMNFDPITFSSCSTTGSQNVDLSGAELDFMIDSNGHVMAFSYVSGSTNVIIDYVMSSEKSI